MKNIKHSIIIIPFFIMVTAFLLLPVFSILLNSFKTEAGVYSINNYIEIFNNAFYLQSFQNSIIISLQSTIIGLIISVIASYSIYSMDNRLSHFTLTITNMTSNFAGVPLAFAFMILLGNNGVFTILFKTLGLDVFGSFNLYSNLGLLFIYVYFQIPLGILLMYPSFDAISKSFMDAAVSLGASKVYFWKRIGVPILRSALTSTGAILFANAMGAYATAYALTNGAFNIVPVRIGALISGDLFLKPNLASALSVILAVILLSLNLISRRRHYAK